MALTVPETLPTLSDSEPTEPSKLQLHFRPSGQYAASTAYICIKVPFNFTKMMEMLALIANHYKNYT
jgi:hypothetical protein